MRIQVLSALACLGLATAGQAGPSASSQATPRVQVPVVGLDAARGPAIERALRALESQGDPPHEKLLEEVSIDVEKGLVQVVVADGRILSLEQVERVLAVHGTRVQRDKFALGEVQFLFDGEAADGELGRLRQALTTDLFATADVLRQGEPPRLVAHVRAGEKPVTLEAAAKAVRGAVSTLRIRDVVWSRVKAD